MYGEILAAVSLALTLLSVGIYYLKMRAVRVPKWPLLNILLKLVAITAGVVAFVSGVAFWTGIAAGFSLFINAMFFLFLAISGLPKAQPAIEVGKRFIDFNALDSEGSEFTLSSLNGRPFLLVFYRGHW